MPGGAHTRAAPPAGATAPPMRLPFVAVLGRFSWLCRAGSALRRRGELALWSARGHSEKWLVEAASWSNLDLRGGGGHWRGGGQCCHLPFPSPAPRALVPRIPPPGMLLVHRVFRLIFAVLLIHYSTVNHSNTFCKIYCRKKVARGSQWSFCPLTESHDATAMPCLAQRNAILK